MVSEYTQQQVKEHQREVDQILILVGEGLST